MSDWSIKSQLGLIFGLVLGLLAATVGYGVWQEDALAALTQKQFKHPFTVTNAVARSDANLSRERLAVAEALLGDEAMLSAKRKEIETLHGLIEQDLQLGRERFLGDKAAFDQLIATHAKVKPLIEAVLAAKAGGDSKKALELYERGEYARLAAEMRAQRMQVYDWAFKKGEGLAASAEVTRTAALAWTLGLGLAALLIGTCAAVWMTGRLTRPLAAASALAQAVAGGDLTQPVPLFGRNETGRLMADLGRMQTSLAGVVQRVRSGSEEVATSSAQIAQGNQDLSARTEQQGSSLQETAASMEELGTTVRHNADNARQANQLASSASSVAQRGGKVVEQVVQTMRGINDSSRRIADIIGTIDGIAFQTNILALNAAVEAARAGEQGRGFAVVATEVRSLAQRSAEAAREIKGLIGASVERVEQGATLVNEAGSTMVEIVSAIARVSDIVAEISSASEEQSRGVGQASQAVSQMDQATQQNAALVEESAAAAESLRQQARRLVEAVAVFKLA
jgi:methyl-accepting chemotaxis protein